MIVFQYDKSFEGLLTAVFDAYALRTFPDRLVGEGESLPLFTEETVTVRTAADKADRVWRGLEKRLSRMALSQLPAVWLSERPEVPELLFRYIRRVIDAPRSIELDFGDTEVLQMAKIWKRVREEHWRVLQFLRFQQAADDTYFAAVSPIYNVLPLTLDHLTSRFADQRWLVYDVKRAYGYYYDRIKPVEVRFEDPTLFHLRSGLLPETLMARDERLFQSLWRAYFKQIAIRERLNPTLHRQCMPERFWKYMPEKW